MYSGLPTPPLPANSSPVEVVGLEASEAPVVVGSEVPLPTGCAPPPITGELPQISPDVAPGPVISLAWVSLFVSPRSLELLFALSISLVLLSPLYCSGCNASQEVFLENRRGDMS